MKNKKEKIEISKKGLFIVLKEGGWGSELYYNGELLPDVTNIEIKADSKNTEAKITFVNLKIWFPIIKNKEKE
jgi:hypothetical protein